jgi:hypothetical protein
MFVRLLEKFLKPDSGFWMAFTFHGRLSVSWKWQIFRVIKRQKNDRKCRKNSRNNVPSHTSLKTTKFVTNNNMVIVPCPPYSLDFAPCDFALFPNWKWNWRDDVLKQCLASKGNHKRYLNYLEVDTISLPSPPRLRDPVSSISSNSSSSLSSFLMTTTGGGLCSERGCRWGDTIPPFPVVTKSELF